VFPETYVRYWPTETAIAPAEGGPTLILFLHPKCPCSRASLTQLERILADLQTRGAALPRSYVIATLPEYGFDEWADTENLQRAAKLPGATVVVDRGGIEAQRFGVTTSGAIILFDDTRKRRYAGGITSARGLEGANVGCDSLLALLQGNEANVAEIPALGCRLCLPHTTQSATKCMTNVCPAKPNL
jgi:hypothetical protein